MKLEILDHAPDTIVLVDLAGNLVYINETGARIRGYSKEKLTGVNLREKTAPPYTDLLAHRLQDTVRKGEATFEDAHFCSDMSIMPVEVHSRSVKFGGREFVLAIARSMALRKSGISKDKIPVLIGAEKPLLADGIISAMITTDDLTPIARATNQAEMLSMVGRFKPHVAVVEFGLLGSNPVQTIRKIKQANRNVRIIVMTSETSHSWLVHCLAAGVAGYLSEKASAAEVINAIGCVCTGEAVLDLRSTSDLAQHIEQIAGGEDYLAEHQPLAERELEILKLASKGLTNKMISKELFISERTVQSQFAAIFNKLGVGSRTEAVLAAWRNSWLANKDSIE